MSDEIRIRSRGVLPHWERDGAVYFVTFRLADSLPKTKIAELKNELAELEAVLRKRGELDRSGLERLAELSEQRTQEYLDRGIGECWLRDPRVASMVADALKYFDGQRYRLHAWCVMPKHAHLMFDLIGATRLEKVLHSVKSYTANRANEILSRGVLAARIFGPDCSRSRRIRDQIGLHYGEPRTGWIDRLALGGL